LNPLSISLTITPGLNPPPGAANHCFHHFSSWTGIREGGSQTPCMELDCGEAVVG
jgi:hypothetical protein